MSKKTNVAILGSGMGSNANALCNAQNENGSYQIVAIIGTKPGQGILDVAVQHNVGSFVVDWTGEEATDARSLISVLTQCQAEVLVLAGFLRKLPPEVISFLGGLVINIHPALLPKHGGRGMFGLNVHRAVLAAGDAESGATVHWVTEQYDEGSTVLQGSVMVHSEDSPESLRDRVQSVEHSILPRALELVCKQRARNFHES